jgi:hypothetical protein
MKISWKVPLPRVQVLGKDMDKLFFREINYRFGQVK